MLLSHKTSVKVTEDQANIIGHMCYAASKLWNVCNYERLHYKKTEPDEYPDWYYQKKAHKDDLWYKQLPSQTAQEICKLLDKAWKSFYQLQRTHGVTNPNPPRFKQENIAITYMQNGIVHSEGDSTVRLTLSKQLKQFMSGQYDITNNFLYLKNKIFKDTDVIKQIQIYPPENGTCTVIVVYEVNDAVMLSDNGRYLPVDIGLHNLMTCYAPSTGKSFIAGRKYLSVCHYFDKEIARVQSQWYKTQTKAGVKYPKMSKHVQKLYKKKNDCISDYLHKVTRFIAEYCHDNGINTVVIGDVTNIRKDNNKGSVTNQKLHSLPYRKLYILLEYKLAMYGIRFVKQNEAYSSQTSPLMSEVCKENAEKSNRIKRGLYTDGDKRWNADCVGAFNILRLYFQTNGIEKQMDPLKIADPYVIKVAV